MAIEIALELARIFQARNTMIAKKDQTPRCYAKIQSIDAAYKHSAPKKSVQNIPHCSTKNILIKSSAYIRSFCIENLASLSRARKRRRANPRLPSSQKCPISLPYLL